MLRPSHEMRRMPNGHAHGTDRQGVERNWCDRCRCAWLNRGGCRKKPPPAIQWKTIKPYFRFKNLFTVGCLNEQTAALPGLCA